MKLFGILLVFDFDGWDKKIYTGIASVFINSLFHSFSEEAVTTMIICEQNR